MYVAAVLLERGPPEPERPRCNTVGLKGALAQHNLTRPRGPAICVAGPILRGMVRAGSCLRRGCSEKAAGPSTKPEKKTRSGP